MSATLPSNPNEGDAAADAHASAPPSPADHDPPAPTADSPTSLEHKNITRAYLAAQQNRRVNLLTSAIRSRFTLHPRRRPALSPTASSIERDERNIAIPLLAAAAARSRASMVTDLNAAPSRSFPPASTLAEHLTNCARFVWGFGLLRKMQRDVLLSIFDSTKRRAQLAVQPTAGGKKLIMKVIGLMLLGIHIIVHPSWR